MVVAFLTGLVGSLHCLGMCGPIAISLPGTAHRGPGYLWGRLVYNLGRLITYSFMGGVVAMLGVAAAMFEVQRWFSLALGAVLIFMALWHYGTFGRGKGAYAHFLSVAWRHAMARAMRLKGSGGLLAIGLMNGLLPCGLVYAGLFIAANSDHALLGMAKMAVFGLGTLPMMLTLSWSGKWLVSRLRTHARWVMPMTMSFLGLMFLLRGMALGIPYLSPRLEQGNAPGKMKMSCCEKMRGGTLGPGKSSIGGSASGTPPLETP
jgi:uncharacterized protein